MLPTDRQTDTIDFFPGERSIKKECRRHTAHVFYISHTNPTSLTPPPPPFTPADLLDVESMEETKDVRG